MIEATHVRTLTLDRGGDDPQGDEPPHLAAASGLVVTAAAIYVVADDEVGLGVFPRHDDHHGPGRMLPLFAEVLPADHHERKAAKPDLEALCRLPAHAGAPHGALLACGSGSAETRHRGVHWPLDAEGRVSGDPRPVDLAALYAALRRELPELNIEGATVSGDGLLLANRGNGARHENAIVTLRLDAVLAALAAGEALDAGVVASLERTDLPDLGGHPLAYSDLTTLPDGRVAFSAIGEDTDDPYEDGAFTGAGIGILGGALHALTPPVKVEGVFAVDADTLLLTADPDDRAVPAPLLTASLSPLLRAG